MKWLSRKFWLCVTGCATVVALGILCAIQPAIIYCITAIVCTGIIALAYVDGKKVDE